jgi:serine/threonine protein kinase
MIRGFITNMIAVPPPARPPSTHCTLAPGDYVGDYQVHKLLGRGRFSAVWGATQGGREVALKIYRAKYDMVDYYTNEVRIFNRLATVRPAGAHMPHIIEYLGTFAHVRINQAGAPCIYPCVVLERGGEPVSKLLKFCARQDRGLPPLVTKKITREILTGLAYLHRNNIIHTDIKPSNVLLNDAVENLDESNVSVRIADLGSSTETHDIFSDHIGTTQYMAPEVIVELPFGPPADIWAAFATCYELFTGDLLFDVYGECGATYGEDVDDLTDSEQAGGEQAGGGQTGGVQAGGVQAGGERAGGPVVTAAADASLSCSSGSEKDKDEERIHYRLLLLIAKVLGYPPPEFTKSARIYYNRRDRPKNHPDMVPIGLNTLLQANYDIDASQCVDFENFLLCGLRYLPEDRVTAHDAVGHPWLAT